MSLLSARVQVVHRDKHGVIVRLKPRTPASGHHNPNGADQGAPEEEELYDELFLCCLADTSKRVLGRTATWRERRVLGSAKFSDDITITHHDADYMKRHYENFYRDDLAVSTLNGKDQTWRLASAKDNFRAMYYIKTYPQDRSKLEMCFGCNNYQSQFPEMVPFEQHVFQTIFLNKDRDGKLWTDQEIAPNKIIRKDWWHQLCHPYTHYLFVVPWMMFLNSAKRHTRFAASWTLVNAREVAVLSGIAAAVDLGAMYPEDLENDKFAFLCFRLHYPLSYGRWYRRNFTSKKHRDVDAESEAASEGKKWSTGLYGSVYNGPGMSGVERSAWRGEMKRGMCTNNLSNGNGEGRSQP